MANTEEIQPLFWVIAFVTYLLALWLIFRLWKKTGYDQQTINLDGAFTISFFWPHLLWRVLPSPQGSTKTLEG